MGKRTDYNALRQGFGLSRGLSDEFIQACERNDVPIEAIHRLVTPNGITTMNGIAQRILSDWEAEQQRPNQKNGERKNGEEYTIPVSYQLPPFAELNGSVFDWASDLFRDAYAWEEHESVRGRVDRTPGERSFLVKHFNKEMTSDEVIAWADKNGYRVATHEEAVDFAKAQPDLQRQFPIVALGSFTVGGDSRYAAILNRNGAKRLLAYVWFVSRWSADCRFLLVRK